MTPETRSALITPATRTALSLGALAEVTPAVIEYAGEEAKKKFWEFFTAQIENDHTRRAYFRAVSRFMDWCEAHRIALIDIEPMLIAAYLKSELKERYSAPTQKLQLAAIRMLMNYLVINGVLKVNPAAAVKGPKHIVTSGKTPVLYETEARRLLDSIDTTTAIGKRDKALLAVMTYSFARVGAVVKMRVKDYYRQGDRAFVILHEKGGKHHKVPAHRKIQEAMDDYLVACPIDAERDSALFRAFRGRGTQLTANGLATTDVLRMIKRRALAAGLPPEVCCHTFRATGLTNYLQHGGTLETAATIANHASTRTTQLYDRRNDELHLDEVERIRI